MWLEANRTTGPIAPVSLDIERSITDDVVTCSDDLPSLRALMAALPLPLIAKCRLLQMLSAPYRTDDAPERLNALWQRHTLAARDAGLPSRMGPMIACALAFRQAVQGTDGEIDRVRSAEAWHGVGGRAQLTAEAWRWVAETIAADRVTALPQRAESLDHARRWVLDLERHEKQITL